MAKSKPTTLHQRTNESNKFCSIALSELDLTHKNILMSSKKKIEYYSLQLSTNNLLKY